MSEIYRFGGNEARSQRILKQKLEIRKTEKAEKLNLRRAVQPQRTGMWFVNRKSSKFKDFLFRTILLNVGFWPEAEDRALRGRNLSAVFRTLNRQVGKPLKRLPSCAQPGG